MTKLITIALLFICMVTAAQAQNRANIKGKVVDSASNEALEKATIAVVDLKDSSLISYTLALKTGEFALHNLPVDKPLKLVISFVTYQNFRKTISLKKGETLDIGVVKMVNKSTSLSEVKVIAEVTPIVVRKDTVEFNAEAFKTPPNAVVEELLKRLPGVQVDMDGTISVNGKQVKKLLIDGKEYFANDPRIASKNLDADLISKVQVYDDRENDPDHLIPDSKVDKIINLKFKKALKKSIGGKVRFAGGTRKRFDEGLLYNMFRDTLQISLIGIANNLNKTGFNNGDLTGLGGFGRSGSESLNDGTVATGSRNYGGIQTVASGGANINTDYGKKLKLNLLYFYSYTGVVFNAISSSQQFLNDTILSSKNNYYRNAKDNRHTISGLVEWKPDTASTLRYRPQLSFTNGSYTSGGDDVNFNNFVPLLNSSTSIADRYANNKQFQHTFSYYHKFRKDGPSIDVSHNLSIRPDAGLSYTANDLVSYTNSLKSSTLRRLQDDANSNTNASLNFTYRHPFSKKIIGDVQVSNNYDYNNGRLFTYDQNLQTGEYSIYIDSLSRNLQRRQFTETVRPELTYQITKSIQLVGNVGLQFMQIYNRFNKKLADLNRYDFFVLPALRLNTEHVYFDYSVNVRQPSISDLLPLRIVYNQLYSSTGNPDLEPTRSHQFSLGYYNYNSEKQLNTNVYSSASVEQNSVFTERLVSSQGATLARPINRNGNYSIYLGGNIGKGFKKFDNWQIRLNSRLSGNFRHSFFQVNNVSGFQNVTGINFNEQITVNWNNKFEFTPSYGFNPSITTYQGVNYNNIKYIAHSLNLPVIIRWPKRTLFEALYNYNYNPLTVSGFRRSINILNLSIARQFQYRDRGEIKLSCYDLLNQNVSAYRYTYDNRVVDQQNQILKRYFLLTYSYRFNKAFTK